LEWNRLVTELGFSSVQIDLAVLYLVSFDMQHGKDLVRTFFGQGITDKEKLQLVVDRFQERTIQKNDLFLAEGRVSNEYLLLERGFMRAFSHDPNGQEVTTAFYSAGQPVYEVASFFMRIPSRENIQALAHCEGWTITFDDLNALFHGIPEFREFGRGILVKSFASLKLRMQSMITETAEMRYEALLRANREIFMHAPLKHIASYLGVTDTSLSRIRRAAGHSQQK
jgi:CRP-like cAMP-binding protein